MKALILSTNRTGFHSQNKMYDHEVVARATEAKYYGPGFPGFDQRSNIWEIVYSIFPGSQPDVICSWYTPREEIKDIYYSHFHIDASHRNRGFPEIMPNGFLNIYMLSDFWHRNQREWEKGLLKSGFRYCFCCFAPPYCDEEIFNSFFNQSVRDEIRFVGLPRCVDKEIYKDYGGEKIYDVITVGNLGSHFYPFRKWAHQTLMQNAPKMGITYTNFPHSGFGYHHNGFVGEKYARAINASKILISCGGKYHLAMNKIFEAMGCGTLYCGPKPAGAEQLHLKDGFNYVAVTENDFLEKIHYYVKHDAQRQQIINNAKQTYLQCHHIDARSEDFKQLIEGIL